MLYEKRDYSIDILKFLAVFLIINSHMDALYVKYGILATGGVIGNVLFLFASGYTLLLSKRNLSFEDEKFNGMELLEGSKYHLYTNIDEIIQSGSPAPILKLGKKICVYTKQNIEIIRIRVARDGDDSMEIARLKPWIEYLKTNS